MGPWDLQAMILMGPRTLRMGPIIDAFILFRNLLELKESKLALANMVSASVILFVLIYFLLCIYAIKLNVVILFHCGISKHSFDPI